MEPNRAWEDQLQHPVGHQSQVWQCCLVLVKGDKLAAVQRIATDKSQSFLFLSFNFHHHQSLCLAVGVR